MANLHGIQRSKHPGDADALKLFRLRSTGSVIVILECAIAMLFEQALLDVDFKCLLTYAIEYT